MEKLAALFNDIFVRDNSDDAPIPLKIVFGGKRRKALEYSKVTMRPLMLGDKLLYQAEYTYPKKSLIPIWRQGMRQRWPFPS